QPAEEGAPEGEEGGAKLMLEEGLFDDFRPDAVFGLHVFSTVNADQLAVRAGPTMAASDTFDLRVIGRQTHGSRPWGAVDPAVAWAQSDTRAQPTDGRQMNTSHQPAVLTSGTIHVGVRHSLIPGEGMLTGTIRTSDDDMRTDI